MKDRTLFEKVAGLASIFGGVCVFLYAVSLVIVAVTLKDGVTGLRIAAILLILGGLSLSLVWVAVYNRLRETEPSFALWALIIGIAGHVGSIAGGGYDFAASMTNGQQPTLGRIISQASPQGLLTFGLVGVSLLTIAWLIHVGGMFPRPLGTLGYVFGILSLWVYPGRVFVVNLQNPALAGPIVLLGFVLGPVFYIWLGITLLNGIVDPRANKPRL